MATQVTGHPIPCVALWLPVLLGTQSAANDARARSPSRRRRLCQAHWRRAAHALKVQARRALKVKIDTLKGKRSRIAKRDIGNKTTRKALSSSIKGLLHTKKAKGDDARALFDAAANGSDDDEWEEDVEMA